MKRPYLVKIVNVKILQLNLSILMRCLKMKEQIQKDDLHYTILNKSEQLNGDKVTSILK